MIILLGASLVQNGVNEMLEHQFNIELVPTAKNTAMPSYIFDDRLVVESGKKVFVTLDEDRNKFMTY